MLATESRRLDRAIANGTELQEECKRLRAENVRLRNENARLRATLDAYIARARSTRLFGPCEMTAGTSVGPRLRRDPEARRS